MWEITRNFIGEFSRGRWVDNDGGRPIRPVQSRDFDEVKAAAVRKWHTFRMFDADGELYYEGRNTEIDFEPLDCYGKPNAGAIDIRYYNPETHNWEPL